jgi:hypothetical protein
VPQKHYRTGHFQKLHEQSLEFGVFLDLDIIVDRGGERLTDGTKTKNEQSLLRFLAENGIVLSGR